MQPIKRYIASFLLLVLGFNALPAHLLHEVFAHHTDAAENHCKFYHKDLGRHIEQKEDHCDVFKTNTPLYDAVTLQHNFTPFSKVVSIYRSDLPAFSGNISSYDLPARAPPIA